MSGPPSRVRAPLTWASPDGTESEEKADASLTRTTPCRLCHPRSPVNEMQRHFRV